MKAIKRILPLTVLVLISSQITVSADCYWEPGDFNCDGTPMELSDVIYAISNYRGEAEACHTCDCGIFGENFPVSADINGNCIPYELSDLVAAIAFHTGRLPFFLMCEDCNVGADREPENAGPNSED